jgi:hypothetical protein
VAKSRYSFRIEIRIELIQRAIVPLRVFLDRAAADSLVAHDLRLADPIEPTATKHEISAGAERGERLIHLPELRERDQGYCRASP